MGPKDPYFIRDSGSDATRYRMLNEATIVQLDQLRRTLQIIVVVLILGVVCFGGFTVISGEGPRTFFGPDRMDFMFAVAVICAVSSVAAPNFVGHPSRGSTQKVQPATQAMLTGEPDHDNAIYESQRIQVATIISCANLEAGAFANLYAFMMTQDLVHLLVTAILVVGIMLRFPIRSRYLRRIDQAGETVRMEEPAK